jgi:hypothetical protein
MRTFSKQPRPTRRSAGTLGRTQAEFAWVGISARSSYAVELLLTVELVAATTMTKRRSM